MTARVHYAWIVAGVAFLSLVMASGFRSTTGVLLIPTAHFGQQAGVVFAWIFAAHQLGAATAAWGAGLIRTHTGEYTVAFLAAGALALVAAAAVLLIRSARSAPPVPAPVM